MSQKRVKMSFFGIVYKTACEIVDSRRFGDERRAKNKKKKTNSKNMKNYKTIIAMAAAGMALVATERSAEASLSGVAYVTEGSGAQPVLQVDYSAVGNSVINPTVWSYTYTFTVGDYVDSVFTATTDNPVTSFSVAASYVNAGSLTSVDGATGVIESGYVVWDYIPSPGATDSDTVHFTSDYGPALGIASGNDGSVSWNSSNPGGEPVAVPAAPVPEASTVMAGALMLLPFGIGAVRSLRKERAV